MSVYEFDAVCHDRFSECIYTVDVEYSPNIISIEPTVVMANPTILTLSGTSFDDTGVYVTVGYDDCEVQESTSTQVSDNSMACSFSKQ